ncbi:MAG: FKBP-type peptidyl-prolyl cis-trans isomerase [Propioniciclava sp.]
MPIRRSSAVTGAVVASLALILTACSGDGDPTPTPSVTASTTPTPTASATPEPVPLSDSIDAITVDGPAGELPEVTIPTPFAIDATRTRVVTAGDTAGPKTPANGILEVDYVGINARTGETFDSSWANGAPVVMSLEQVVPGFQEGLTDRRPGDRMLIVIPGEDAYDAQGGQPSVGIEVGDTLVFVVDIHAAGVEDATGAAKSPALPVRLGADDDDYPTLTVGRDAPAPSEPLAATVIQGSQRGVQASDYIMVKYRSYSWSTGELIEDRYAEPDGGPLSSTIEDWKTGLEGKPIGSRVIIVAPDAYPRGNEDPAITAGDPLVFVVDILFASSAIG